MTPLRQRMIDDMTVRGLAENTRKSYLGAVTGLARHYRQSPDSLDARQVQDYLIHLHEKRGLTWTSCNTARHAIRFFYRITLGLPDPHLYVPGAKQPSKLPEILNHDELVRLFTVATAPKHRALLMTAYAAGLRASELTRLRVADIDSGRMTLRVDQGKGNKDRYVPLSPQLLEHLRGYWRRERPEHWLFPGRCRDGSLSRHGPAHIYTAAKTKADIDKAGGHPYPAPLLRHGSAGGRRRTHRHPAPPRTQFHPLHHALPAPGAGENRGHALTAGPDGVPGPSLTGARRQPPGAGTAAGAGGGRYPQGTD